MLSRFRALLAGQRVATWTLTGFSNLALPEGSELETPWGLLRPVSPRLSQISPFGTRATALLETEFSLGFRVGEPSPDPQSWAADIEASFAAQRQAVLLLPLSVLLGLDREQRAVAEFAWNTTVLPAEAGGGFTGQIGPSWPGSAPGPPLESAELEGVGAWMHRLASHYNPAVEIAVRRTLSAARGFHLRAQADSLIDAVIAWENLVGPEEPGESTFRVTAALAHLLEKAPAERDATRRRLAKVYRARSKVVHGLEPGDLAAEREEAVRVALEALRRLFLNYPDLIPDRGRGTRFLLGEAATSGSIPC
jgi:hypothetical protein